MQSIKYNPWLIIVLLGSYTLVGMGVDLIAPALPAMSHDLGISKVFIKNLISIYLVGYAVGNFVFGVVTDSFGRQKLMYVSLGLYTLVSLWIAIFPAEFSMLVGRCLQGFTIAGFAVLTRAILADVLSHEKLISILVVMATMWGLGPVLGPAIGGYLQSYFGWEACFYFYAAYSALILIALLFLLPETHFKHRAFNVTTIKASLVEVLSNRQFIGFTLMMGLSYALLIGFNTAGPFFIQSVLGKSPIFFGHLAMMLGVCFLLGTIVCRKVIKRFAVSNIQLVAIAVTMVLSLAAILLGQIYPKNLTLLVAISAWVFFVTGIIFPSAMSRGVALMRHTAGSASAIMNLGNVMITSSVAAMMSVIVAGSVNPIIGLYCVAIIGCAIVWFFCRAND